MNINRFNLAKNQPVRRLEIKKMKDEMPNFTEGVMPTVRELLCSRGEREVPENDKFTRVYVAFDIPNSTNEGFLDIAYDSSNPKTGRLLSTNVHHKNSDRIFKHFIKEGTKQEILDYIKDNNNQKEIISSLMELSQKVDDYYSQL